MCLCAGCGVVAEPRGRRTRRLHDIPAFGAPVQLEWRQRRYRCLELACPVGGFSEEHDLAVPRAKLTVRAAWWAISCISGQDHRASGESSAAGGSHANAFNVVSGGPLRRSDRRRAQAVGSLRDLTAKIITLHRGRPGTRSTTLSDAFPNSSTPTVSMSSTPSRRAIVTTAPPTAAGGDEPPTLWRPCRSVGPSLLRGPQSVASF